MVQRDDGQRRGLAGSLVHSIGRAGGAGVAVNQEHRALISGLVLGSVVVTVLCAALGWSTVGGGLIGGLVGAVLAVWAHRALGRRGA
jgi:hypothetical protein